jgi:endonuclease YncB( thermonuclease family)
MISTLAVIVFFNTSESARLITSESIFKDYSDENYEKAMADAKLVLQAQEDRTSSYVIGRMYYFGQGVKQDYSKAFDHIYRAAKQGLPMAQNDLGTMYEEGLGVDKSCQKAFKWYLRSMNPSLKTDSTIMKPLFNRGLAQFSVAMMYLTGSCLGQDKEEARFWLSLSSIYGFRKAAETYEKMFGNTRPDIKKLGEHDGVRTPTNPVEAYKLSMMAALVGGFKAMRVVDGYTFVALGKNTEILVRLVGIDPPKAAAGGADPGQAFALEAKSHLENLVLNKKVEIKCYDVDSNNTILGVVTVDGVNVNHEVLRSGLARAREEGLRYGFDVSTYKRLESAAKVARVGLWADEALSGSAQVGENTAYSQGGEKRTEAIKRKLEKDQNDDYPVIRDLIDRYGKEELIQAILKLRGNRITIFVNGRFLDFSGPPSPEFVTAQTLFRDIEKLQKDPGEFNRFISTLSNN